MKLWGYHVPILAYHCIGPVRSDHVTTLSLEAFEKQMSFLARYGYRVVDLDTIMRCMETGKSLPGRPVAITFDDGYEGICRFAWPVLRHFGFPAAVFVMPTEVGLPGFANWEQLSQMAQNGILIGSHTMNHTYLPLVEEKRLVDELVQSKRMIEERIGRQVRHLSYPVGGFTPLAMVMARRAGYAGAVTTNRGWSRWQIDQFALRRIKMAERDTSFVRLWAKLSGYYNLFRRLEQPG